MNTETQTGDPTITPAPLLLSVAESAAVLGVKRTHFYKLHNLGRIPLPVRLGKSVRWSRDELVRWIKAGCPERGAWEVMKKRSA